MFFTLFGYWAPGGGGGGGSQGIGTQPAYAVFHPGQLKNLKRPSKIRKACFSPYLCVFHPIWVFGAGGGGGSNLDWCTTCLCTFSSQNSSKIEVSETYFLDIVITSNDHPRYVKHVLARIYVFFTLF